MPIPKPKQEETLTEYVQRCMINPTMIKEYGTDQRYAICIKTFEESR